ncbi:MAG: di-trans,poly-cis-decaprenylcistransferase, partial [Lachnospiraceae bacterium]|nr:di-trans,poly-cis-decaprenylcistransferase [Lachnospiraceae bacterium]
FVIAINYGGRDELTRAAQKLAKEAAEGKIRPEDITEQMITDSLDTAGLPDPDLLIRTAGEKRLSNYLLWQSAYTEFYYTDVLWPDFHKEHLEAAIEEYSHRSRRYGGR